MTSKRQPTESPHAGPASEPGLSRVSDPLQLLRRNYHHHNNSSNNSHRSSSALARIDASDTLFPGPAGSLSEIVDSADSSFNTHLTTSSTECVTEPLLESAHDWIDQERARLVDRLYALLLDGPRIDMLSRLPYEIATYILYFVDMSGLAKVAVISKAWNQLANDNEVWKSAFLYQRHWRIRIPHRLDPVYPTLDWKQLCRDHKELDSRWRTAPYKTKLLGHQESVYCIQFDSTKIVTGSRDRTIKFWDLTSHQCTDTLTGHSQSVLCLQFNESIMVSGSSDNTIIVWDMETRKVISRLYGHTAGVLDVCFDDQYIISCSKDTHIKVWDVHTRVLVKTMAGHRGPVNAVQLHQGQVVSASGDGLVKLWDVATGLCVRDFIGHERGLACVQFDGTTIVSGSNDKTIRIWEAATGKCLRILTGHENLVRTLHFAQNRIVSGSYDYSVKVWDMTTGECTLNLDNGHASWVFDVQFSSSRIIR
ncbi:hypothetical protein BGZ70_007937 [Mortierella alpina]|uniref:F-box domain-containing protein n=1 Tax=Mortierella alpina TaxID=64518 RepID=A0A9P6J7W1_MORAP|nr:hypothetical protein BGZ70_007937 [Mortierella alpina]